MARPIALAVPITFALLLACGLSASPQADQPKAPSAGQPAAVTLGQSLVPLYGPWRFQVGDSPLDPATGKPLWAEPGFDDSGWEKVDLTPTDAASGGVVGGWGARGHKGYAGYAWYRIRITVHATARESLTMEGPANFDDAYQVFLNGRLLGGFGQFDGKWPKFFYAEPAVFPLVRTQNAGEDADADAGEVIAFRFWMAPSSLLSGPDVGGLHTPPLLGTTEAIGAVYQLGWLDLVKQNAVWALTGVVYFLLAAIAFALFAFNRSDHVYLWMGAFFFVMSIGCVETAWSAWTQDFTVSSEMWICNVFVIPALKFVWYMLLWTWFRMDRPRWLPWSLALLSVVLAFAYACALHLIFPVAGSAFATGFYDFAQALNVVYLLLFLWILICFVPKTGVEGWLLVPPFVLSLSDLIVRWLTFLHLPRIFHPFGVYLHLQQVTGFLMAMAMCALLVRRWVLSARAQRVIAQELKQAQEVQQVLIPEAVAAVPGFAIESVYQPAGQVGGDFFQILPAKDGAVLVCIGDVSGKGMPAAMTVSLLVGTLRTLAHYTQNPGEILAAMNQRMIGRSRGGFTTCLVLVATPDGTVTLANAGHIPPYLNGKELPLESGLPLGLAGASAYPETMIHQEEGEQIALVTDGVVEARAASGELFGFERTAAIAHLPAQKVAHAAREFGQDDDITVLTLTRLGAGATAPIAQVVAVLSPSVA